MRSIVTCAILLAAVAPSAFAETHEPTAAVRRVFVPADRPEVWPTGGETHLPIKVDRLQQMLSDRPAPSRQAASLQLDARWSDGALVGEGRLRVDNALWVAWPASAMRIIKPQWETGRQAAFGLWPSASTAGGGVHGLASEGPGVLTFGFRVPATARRGSDFEFVLQPPAALRRSIEIRAPDWLRFSGPGLITQRIDADAETPAWRLEAPPNGKLVVTAEDTRPANAPAAQPLSVAERTRLLIQADAIKLTSRLKLESSTPLPAVLRVATPAGLLLESALLDGEPLTLTPRNSKPATGDATAVPVTEVQLPASNRPSMGTLKLSGVVPFPFEEDFPAPRPQLLGVEWTEGVLTISTRPGLQIMDAYAGQGAAQEPTSSSPDRLPSTLAYRLLGPQGTVWMRLASHKQRINARLSRTVRLGADADQATLRVTIDSVSGPPPTALDFALSKGWRVESVESQPATLLDRWAVLNNSRANRLRLVLNNDAPGLANASLVVRAQRSSPLRFDKFQTLRMLQALRPLGVDLLEDRWEISAPDFRRIAPVGLPRSRLAKTDPATAEITGDESADGGAQAPAQAPDRTANADNDAVDRLTLQMAGTGRRELAEWGIRVDDRQAPLAASLSVSATQTAAGIGYRLSADFNNRRAALEPIEVWFDRPLPATTSWSELRSGRPLKPTPRDGGRRWRLTPTSGEGWSGLVAEALLPAADGQPIPLAAVAGAEPRSARLTVGPRMATRGWITFPSGTPRKPIADAAPGSLSWRYDPEQVLSTSLAPSSLAASGAGVLWSLQQGQPEATGALQSLTTQYNAAGATRHTAEYDGLTPGTPMRFRLPAGATLLDVATDARPSLPTTLSADGAISVNADALAGAQTIKIRYSTVSRPLRHNDPIAPLPPESPPSPASFVWRVELPAGYRLAPPNKPAPPLLDRIIGGPEFWSWRGALTPRSTPEDNLRTQELITSTSPAASARVKNPTTQRRWLIGIVALAAIAGSLTSGFRVRLWVLSSSACLAAALVSPVGFAGPATAWWIGWLIGAPMAIVVQRLTILARQPAPQQGVRRPAASSGSTTVTRPTAWLVIAAIACSSGTATAEQPPSIPAPPPEKILLPLDKQGKPAGNKAYVREAWLEHLLAANDRRKRAEPGDALLRSLECRGVFRRSPGGALEPARWTLRVELTTFARMTRVSLPLRRGDANWPPTISVDGQPLPLRWEPSGAGCSFEVDEPGDSRAEIRFTPAARVTDGESCVRLGLFAMSDARLSIDFPADQRDMRTPFLRSRVTRDDLRGRLRASLAAAQEVLICWTDEQQGPPPRSTEVDVMQWVRISPRGVYLLVQGQAVEAADASADWEFDTPRGCQRIDPPAPKPDQPMPQQVAFRLPRSSIEGRIRPPLVRVLGGKVRSRSLAFSIDGQYEWSLETNDDTRSLDTDEFLDRWAPKGLVPEVDRAMLIAGEAGPTLAVSPMRVDPLLSQRVLVTANRGHTTCRYVAEYDGTSARLVGQRAYLVPEDLHVRNVHVESGGDVVASRWSRPQPNKLVVFYRTEQTADRGCRVVVEAQSPSPPADQQTVSLIADRSSKQPIVVSLATNDSLIAQPLGEAWRPLPSGAAANSDAEPIATATLQPDAPSLRYLLSDNNFAARLNSVTTFDRDETGRVSAAWSVLGEVATGQLRRIPITVEPGVTLNETVEPADAVIEIADRVGGPDYWLVLPERLVAGQAFSFRLSAVLPDTSRSTFSATPLRVAKPLQSTARAAIRSPAPGADAAGEWRWSGLRPIAPPQENAAVEAPDRSLRFFEPTGAGVSPRFCWSITPEQASAGPRVDLASHRVVLGPSGGVTASSALVVTPGGARSCRIRLPSPSRLLAATVDGAWTPTRRVAEGEWEVLLRGAQTKCVLRLTADRTAITGALPTPSVIDADGADRHAEVTLYEFTNPGRMRAPRLTGGERLSVRQLMAARRHAEADNGLPARSLAPRTLTKPDAAGERGLGFIALGPHDPPTLEPVGRLAAVFRYAAAVLIVAVAAAGVTRELWAPRRTPR